MENILAQERLVPFDHQGKITLFTSEYNPKILKVSYTGKFMQAELLADKDSSVVLEIMYSDSKVTYRKRVPITYPELETLRNSVDSLLIISETDDSQGARSLLLTGCLFSGLCIYGPTLPVILNASTSRGAVGLYMLGAGSSFFIPYFLSRNQKLTYGQSNLTFYGLTRGYFEGLILNYLLGGGESSRSYITAAFLTGITEGVGLYHFVKSSEVSDGTANLMKVYGDFGFYVGMAIANQLDIPSEDSKLNWSIVLAGNIGGLTAAYKIGKRYPLTTGDAEVISTTGMLGSFLPLSIITAINPESSQAYTTPVMIAGIAGCYIGHKLTQNQNFTFSQGYITKMGTIAGALVGLGATYLLIDNAKNWQYLAGSYIGAQTSFCLLYKLNSKSNKLLGNRLHVNFMPANFIWANSKSIKNPYYYSMFPILQCSLKLDWRN